MGTIVSSTTQTRPIGYPSNSAIDRDQVTGALWAVVRNTAGALEFRKSIDGGATWGSALLTYTNANMQEWAFFIDNSSNLHMVIRTNQSSQDRLYYKRVWIGSAPTLGGDVLILAPPNGGVAGSVYSGLDIAAVRFPGGYYNIAVVAGTVIGAKHGISNFGIYMDAQYNVTINNSLLGATRNYLVTGSGRQTPTAVLETADGGNGKGSSVPHLWINFGRTGLYLVKLAWKGSGGWSSPTTATTLKAGIPAMNSSPARWDGQRWISAIPNPTQTDQVLLIERNRANTTTTQRSTPTHPTGVITQVAVNYDTSNHNARVFAVGTSTSVLYSVEYNRATASWGAWVTVLATAVKNGDAFNVRRGTYGNAKHDVATAHADNTVLSTAQGLTYPPNTPVLQPQLQQAYDVNTALVWNWTFSDPDPNDTQSAWALRRQIGAGAFQWLRNSDGTWQSTEQKNTNSSLTRTLAAGWGADADANHTYAVKVWDSADNASAYSPGQVVTPSVYSNPTITAPTASQVLSTADLTVSWTVGSYNGLWRIKIVDTANGNMVAYDSGWRVTQPPASPDSYDVPYSLPNGFVGRVELQTYNTEALPSVLQVQNFSVAYVGPPAPSVALAALPAQGVIRAIPSTVAPVGAQPGVSALNLWRRPVHPELVPLGTDGGFEANSTGWSVLSASGSSAWSTLQAHAGIGSFRLIPDGTSANARMEWTTSITIDPLKRYRCEGWVRPDTANKQCRVYIAWFDASDVFLFTNDALISVVAGTWLYIAGEFAPPATAGKARLGAGINGTPAAGDAAYFDELQLSVASVEAPVLIGAGMLPGTAVDDFQARALTDYEYQAAATGVNGTVTTGPWYA